MSFKIDRVQLEIVIKNDEARKRMRELEDSAADLKKQLKKLPEGSAEWNKVKSQLNKTTKEMDGLYDKIGLTGLSMKELTKRQRELNAMMRGMDPRTKEYAALDKQLGSIKGRMKELRSGAGSTGSSIGKLKGIAGGMLPAFGWAAIAAGAVAVGKKIFNLADETFKYRQSVQKLTGETGKDLADLTSKVQATANTFDKDFNETLIAANSYAKTMGISVDKSLGLINKGFIAGADSSGEFLDMLREYGPQFKAAGLEADQAIALMSQSVKDGVYSDKGADTIKEGMLRLREMPKATQEALENIGISSTKMKQELANGTITVYEAMQQVSNKLGELPPQSAEVGTAIADIFGGPGEDAGLEFIKTIGKVKGGLDDVIEQSGETGKAQTQLLEANQKLSKAWSDLLGEGTGVFTQWKASSKLFLADGLAKLVTGIQKLRNWFIDLYNNSLPFRAYVQGFGLIFKQQANIIVTSLKYVWSNLKTVGKIIKAVFTGDWKNIGSIMKEGFTDAIDTYKAGAEKAKGIVSDYVEKVKNSRIEVKKIVDLNKDLVDVQNKYNNLSSKTGIGNKQTIDAFEQQMKTMQASINKMQDQINKYAKETEEKMMADSEGMALDMSSRISNNIETERKKLEQLQKELEAVVPKEEISIDDQEASDLEVAREAHNNMLLDFDEYESAKTAIQQKYSDIRKQIADDEDDYKRRNIEYYFAKANELAQMSADFILMLQDMQFAAIDNKVTAGVLTEEEGAAKKIAVQKKYADAQFVIDSAQIVSSTALAVMKTIEGFASMPIIGQILAGIQTAIIIGTGATQLAEANQARNRVKQLRSGKYNVIGEEDGRHYSAPLVQRFSTGLISRPTLVAEEPEIVIDPYRTNEIMTLNPDVMQAIMNPTAYTVSQRASGKYPDNTNNASQSDQELKQILTLIAAKLDRPVKATVDYYGSNGIKEATTKDAEMQSNLLGE